MQQALLIRLRPLGPWRYGPGDGAHDRVDTLYRSDRLYSAVTLAMRQLGFLEEWLDATARTSTPAVAFSSLFPFQGDTLFAPPPATLWPPPPSLVTSPSPVFLTKTRWKAARFVPVSIVESLFTGQPILADQWLPDAESGCLLRRDRPNSSPFRVVVRSNAAVDRLTRSSVRVEASACVEFEAGSGLWTVARFADNPAEAAWSDRIKAAFRLLADSGFGARRSSGWGQTAAPEFQSGAWPAVLMPKLKQGIKTAPEEEATDSLYWLLSLYSPAAVDAIDWSGGFYELTVRGGRVESSTASGAVKKQARMVEEGSVLAASAEPVGAAVDVAPDGFAHPVYRAGFALTLKLPILNIAPSAVEETPDQLESLLGPESAEEAAAEEVERAPNIVQGPEPEEIEMETTTEQSEPSVQEEVLGPVEGAPDAVPEISSEAPAETPAEDAPAGDHKEPSDEV
jgi:CRISPR type III-A-associated RAMP protein Csm4